MTLASSMNPEHDIGKYTDIWPLRVALPMQLEFGFARAAGVSVENLKRRRALRRTHPAPRPRLTELSVTARAVG